MSVVEASGRTTAVWIAGEDLAAARDAVATLSRRGKRLGTGPIELREVGRAGDRVRVEVRGNPPRLGGYRVVATLHHEGGETAVERLPGERLDERRWTRAEPWCEHCAVRRRRHTTYLLRRDRELVQVGSSCLSDFTGERDPARAVRQAHLLAHARREATERAGLEVDEAPAGAVELERFLGHVAALAGEEGFRSRRRAEEGDVEASADRAWRALGGPAPARTSLSHARDVIRWARSELADRVERSEYEDRLVWALSRPRLGPGERYLVASALGAYARERDPYLGEAGERITAAVWVELASREGRRGRYGVSYLHRLRDGFGRLLVWYATDRRLGHGERYELRGTVRRRGRFGSEPATVVHRCRVREATRGSRHRPGARSAPPSGSSPSGPWCGSSSESGASRDGC